MCEGSFDDNTSAGYFHKILMDFLSNRALTASHESKSKDETSTNGASYAALDILSSPRLTQNVSLRKTLQSTIEPPSARKMNEIRRGFSSSTVK